MMAEGNMLENIVGKYGPLTGHACASLGRTGVKPWHVVYGNNCPQTLGFGKHTPPIQEGLSWTPIMK